MELGELVKQKMMEVDIYHLRARNEQQAERIKQLEAENEVLKSSRECLARIERIAQLEDALKKLPMQIVMQMEGIASEQAMLTVYRVGEEAIAKINEVLGSE